MDNLSLPFILFEGASPKQRTTWVYLLSYFKWQVLKQRTTWVYLLSCFKRQVLNNGEF